MEIVDKNLGFFVTRANPLEIYSYKITEENRVKISNIIDLGNKPLLKFRRC